MNQKPKLVEILLDFVAGVVATILILAAINAVISFF
jgi:hypothetical protein